MYLRRFRLAEFIRDGENIGVFPDVPYAFKICSICSTKDPQTAEILVAVANLVDRDKLSFKLAMARLLKVSVLDPPLKAHYDKKQYHDAFEFSYKGKTRKVLRVRNNNLRLVFYFGNDNIILLTDTFAKHKDNWTEAETNRSKEVVKRYLDATTHTIIEEKK